VKYVPWQLTRLKAVLKTWGKPLWPSDAPESPRQSVGLLVRGAQSPRDYPTRRGNDFAIRANRLTLAAIPTGWRVEV